MSKHNKTGKSTPTRAIKHATSYKLSNVALDIVAELAIKRGIAKSAVIETLLRDERDRESQRR